MFSRKIANELFWIPEWLTVFQTLSYKKNVGQSRYHAFSG